MSALEFGSSTLSRVIRDAAAHKRLIKWGYVRQLGGLYPSECDSIAAHSNAVAALAIIFAMECKDAVAEATAIHLNIETISLMATFHDYGECRSGDTGASSYATRGTCNLHFLEREGLSASLENLRFRERALQLFDDYRGYATAEAVIVHIADNLEGLEKALHAARGAIEILNDAFRIFRDNLEIYAARANVDPTLGKVTDFLVLRLLLPGALALATAYDLETTFLSTVTSYKQFTITSSMKIFVPQSAK